MKLQIGYYAFMENCNGNTRYPKYRIVKEAMQYPPMSDLIGRDGLVSMYLKENRSNKPDAPELNLQAKNSLNFTGVKFLCADGDMSTWAYGNPFQKPTYSKDNKRNPFYHYRYDCYILRMIYDTNVGHHLPVAIELIVLFGEEGDRLKQMAISHCRQFQMGCYNEELKAIRDSAGAPDSYFGVQHVTKIW